MSVRIGLSFGGYPFQDAEGFWRWVDLCEAGDVDSLWLSERLVSKQPLLEPVTALAAMAGRTSRLKFGTNLTVLPLHENPVLLAKEFATIDYLSDGRFLPAFGVGGDAMPEFAALGLSKRGRGERSNEMLQLIQRLWSEDDVSFKGKYFQYQNVSISPKPRQSPVPLWIGGSSDAAIDRTARYGSGWLAGAAQSPSQLGGTVAVIKQRAIELGRPIDEDHFGGGFNFRFGSWDEPVVHAAVAALATRLGRDVDPKGFIAVGDAEDVMRLIEVYRGAGLSKFVLRPLAANEAEMLEQTRRLDAEVLPHYHRR
jgi:probable F420-dependent oxidoreductase